MSVPNSFTSGTTISSSSVNANFTDIASEITGSLPRDGQAAMTGQFKASTGSAAAPSISFSSDTNTGLFRKASDELAFAVGGTEVGSVTTTGWTLSVAVSFTGVVKAPSGTVAAPGLTFTDDTDCGVYRIGANNLGVAVNGAKVLDVGTAGLGVTGTLTSSGALTVSTGGALISAGGLTVTAGGLTVTAGSVSFPAGSIANAALAAPSGLVLISTQTASSSSQIDFTSGLDDTYDCYEIRISNLKVSVDDTEIRLRIGTGAGPTYQTTAYSYQFVGNLTGSTEDTGGTAQAYVLLGCSTVSTRAVGNDTGENYNAVIEFNNPDVGDSMELFFRGNYSTAGGSTYAFSGGGRYGVATVTGIRIYPESGNFVSGRFSLYGYRKS